ncbi:MAG: MFS transporter [Acidobacteriota bacterium]
MKIRRDGEREIFYGWWVVVASFITLGFAVGLPYFGMTFFYDYFERPLSEGGLGWPRTVITLGLPIGTLSTLWVGPLLLHRFPPRRLILIGTGISMLALLGFSRVESGPGGHYGYYGLYILYMIANNLSGGVSHQIILSRWFVRQRGLAISIGYLGVSLGGALAVPLIAEPLTRAYGFRTALQVMGMLLLLTWPLVLLVMRDDPREMGLKPDGDGERGGRAPHHYAPAQSYGQILRGRVFWILLGGGVCLAGSVGAVNLLLKLILKDRGAVSQVVLDQTFSRTLMIILLVSAVARILVGRLADRLAKRHMLTLTWLPLVIGIPLLASVPPGTVPVLFCLLYGIALGADYLLLVVTAADLYEVATLPRVLAAVIPVMTVGQTWTPYGISLIREASGSYKTPLAIIFILAIIGRGLLILLPFPAGWGRAAPRA